MKKILKSKKTRDFLLYRMMIPLLLTFIIMVSTLKILRTILTGDDLVSIIVTGAILFAIISATVKDIKADISFSAHQTKGDKKTKIILKLIGIVLVTGLCIFVSSVILKNFPSVSALSIISINVGIIIGVILMYNMSIASDANAYEKTEMLNAVWDMEHRPEEKEKWDIIINGCIDETCSDEYISFLLKKNKTGKKELELNCNSLRDLKRNLSVPLKKFYYNSDVEENINKEHGIYLLNLITGELESIEFFLKEVKEIYNYYMCIHYCINKKYENYTLRLINKTTGNKEKLVQEKRGV